VDIPWYGSVEMTNDMGDDGSEDEGSGGSNSGGGGGGEVQHHHRAIGVICQKDLSQGDNGNVVSNSDSIIVNSSASIGGSITCYNSTRGNLLVCEPTTSTMGSTTALLPASNNQRGTNNDGYFSSLLRPVASASLGLDSNGSVYHHFGTHKKSSSSSSIKEDYRDAVLTVFTVTVCESSSAADRDEQQQSNMSSSWSRIPSQRHWLLISSPGDDTANTMKNGLLQDSPNNLPQAAADNNNNDAAVVKAGATTDILFELTCGENPISGLVPTRIVKEVGGRRIAVVFSTGFFGGNYDDNDDNNNNGGRVRTHTRTSPNAVAYTILDMNDGLTNNNNSSSSSSSFQLRHGRDVAFLPPSLTEGGTFYCSSLIVLDPTGAALSITTAITASNLPEGENERVVESIQTCSLQYEGIEGRRVFALLNNSGGSSSSSSNPAILLAGYSKVVGRPCLLLSKHYLERDNNNGGGQLTLVEDTGLGCRLWLRLGEEILSVVELPPPPRHDHHDDPSSPAASAPRFNNIAVASQERVMILSLAEDSRLTIIAEIDVHVTCASLSPLGSHCVAFCASSSSGGGTVQIMYLSCLHDNVVGSHGIIASLPTGSQHSTLLAAIRPDRLVYFSSHGSLQRVVHDKEEEEEGEHEHTFVTPLPCTRPLVLLEPLVANALCQDGTRGTNAASNSDVQFSLRTIIEKFGRKDMAYPHSDDQGIGTFGTGITSQVYDMLVHHKCHVAAEILLTGNLPSDDSLVSHQPKLHTPPWITMQSKLSAATDVELMMQVLSCGDSDLAGFLRHSDRETTPRGVFPGPLDVSSILAEELAFGALKEGSSATDAIKLLDLAGRPSSESLLAQLAFSMGTSPSSDKTLSDSEKLLQEIANTWNGSSGNNAGTIDKYARLCSSVGLRLMRQQNSGTSSEKGVHNIPVSHLAPSVQSVWESDRVRNTIINNSAIETVASSRSSLNSNDAAWKQSFNKNKHVWSAGPFGKKESLLELDGFEDWLGRCRPAVLGKEGVAIAADTGERTLADILSAAAQDDDEAADDGARSGNSVETSLDSRLKNWVEGVGEGRLDEDNLSLYIRFSEGADEDGNWKADGFTDLSKHAHLARLYGSELASVEATTSSVDEGEEGKVRLLYDLVYREGAPRDQATGVVVEAPRGGSLDVGMLHNTQYTSRQRCTIELWYHLPQADAMVDDIILVRRSLFYEENDDATKLCLPDEKHNTLWELAVLPTGLLELRTGAGSVVTSAMFIEEGDNDVNGLVSWERNDGGGGWNHVCLVLSSLSHSSPTECSASILMNGDVVVPNAALSVNPFGSESDHDLNQDDIEDAMEKTVLIFGIGPAIGFRMTDLRIWACQRSQDDIKMMMYEYLRDAEMKKKLKVNIRKGTKKSTGGASLPLPIRLPRPESKKGFALAPPPMPSPARRPLPAADSNVSPDDKNNVFFANFADIAVEPANEAQKVDPRGDLAEAETSPSFATFEDKVSEEARVFNKVDKTVKLDPPEDSVENEQVDPPEDSVENETTPEFESSENSVVKDTQMLNRIDDSENLDPQNDLNDFVKDGGNAIDSNDELEKPEEKSEEVVVDIEQEDAPMQSSFDVTFSDLLSTKVRKSAAAAIIRGPPAARHFGGNRGGLAASDHVNFGSKCDGVSPIAICGADKSVVWFSDRDPPGRTYPIGASGAVLSDVMDGNQSEYMCCFLAKEKRMVVFELSRKTVVVELQMKTKLNFWRYLPPEAHGSDLAFILITPIGGFHWKPLDESPRPCQVWKRGPELESKKILSYEEGGTNGQTGANVRSTVALVIASSATPKSTTVEAYCIAMNGRSSMLCMSNVILGAALYHPASAPSLSYSLPFVVTISKDVTSQYVLDIEDLIEESNSLIHGNILASTVLDMGAADFNLDESYYPPSMSMGPSPEALCCCHDGFIAVVIRRIGLVFAYDFSSGELFLVGKSGLGQYVVDAAIRSSNLDGEVELVLLLCESDDPKDGRIATVSISRVGGVSSQYLSSI
ncbi:hypothetical protein ACHAXR_010494, partial [Thalassiosira sp. AJA248-18]